MSKPTHVNMPIPETMARGIRHLIEEGEFASQAEYIRHLIRADLPKRLAALEQDRIVLKRLEHAQKDTAEVPPMTLNQALAAIASERASKGRPRNAPPPENG